MEKRSTALEALRAFRKRAASTAAPSAGSGTSTSSSASSMSVEGPSTKSISYNTPRTGHIGLFKSTGFANTGRIKTSTTSTGLLAGMVGGSCFENWMPKVGEYVDPDDLTEADITMSPEQQRHVRTSTYPVAGAGIGAGAGALAALLLGRQRVNPLVPVGVGAATGVLTGSLLRHRGNRPDPVKEGALSKFALGIEQPNMITKSMKSAAGRQGGYTAGNLAKGSGAFKPTRLTSTLTEGKSSALDKR